MCNELDFQNTAPGLERKECALLLRTVAAEMAFIHVYSLS